MRVAEQESADYVLAQDPDADRFSAAQFRYHPPMCGHVSEVTR